MGHNTQGQQDIESMPQTGFIYVHNVISGSEAACFKAYKVENADRFTNKLKVQVIIFKLSPRRWAKFIPITY